MNIETERFCPLGKVCRSIKDGKIMQCEWFVGLAGTDHNTGEQVDQESCAVRWLPVLLCEVTGATWANKKAVEGLHHEIVTEKATRELVKHRLMEADRATYIGTNSNEQ